SYRHLKCRPSLALTAAGERPLAVIPNTSTRDPTRYNLPCGGQTVRFSQQLGFCHEHDLPPAPQGTDATTTMGTAYQAAAGQPTESLAATSAFASSRARTEYCSNRS